MILKSLTLSGIRSYVAETTIPIPMGITLFEGDMASGKSTILYAIEFALFGLGSFKGTFLLNNKEKRGDVTLFFEIDGKEYQVHRALQRKGKNVQQVDCYIDGPDGKVPLAATELKERILQLLKFNEPPNPRAQSVIYRYAIFTPQEEMKTVIEKDPDERLQTLRRAFGIEQYKIAVQNSSAVASRIKERMDLLQGASSDLEVLRRRQDEEDREHASLETELKSLIKNEAGLKAKKDIEKASLDELNKAREAISVTAGSVPLLERELDQYIERQADGKDKVKGLTRRIEDSEQSALSLKKARRPTEKSRQELRSEVQAYRTKKENAKNLASKLEDRIDNFESIVKEGRCPVCEREVDPKDFGSKSGHLKEEKRSLDQEIGRYDETIGTLEGLEDELGVYETSQTDLQNLASKISDLREQLEEQGKVQAELTSLITGATKQLDAAREKIKPLEDLQRKIEAQEERASAAENDWIEAGKEIVGIKRQVETLEQSRLTRGNDIKMKEEQRRKRDSLVEDRTWLTQYMSPTIENIEKHVMNSLNQSFNLQFQKWFQILMNSAADLQVRVDEEFSPIIEREEYEQEYQALSGGERTSVALAYRLALNMTVQEVVGNGQDNLLILDEPTDGFSKEQLSRVRDVLRELKAPQVILVSHETELEGFADHVVRVENSNGTSTVRLQSN